MKMIKAWIARHPVIMSSIFTFFLLRIAGDLQLVETVNKIFFPESGSFGATQITLSSLPGAGVAKSESEKKSVYLFLLKHDKDKSEEVLIFTKLADLTSSPVLIGSLEKELLLRQVHKGLPPTRVLLDADLPPGGVVAIGTYGGADLHSGEGVYSYQASQITVDPVESPSLIFSTRNEQRNIHFLYTSLLIFIGWICLSITPYKSLDQSSNVASTSPLNAVKSHLPDMDIDDD